MTRLRLQRKVVFVTFSMAVFVTFALYKITSTNDISFRADAPSSLNRFLVHTAGCKIPDYHPFDASVRHLFRPVRPLVCPGPPSLVIFNQTHISIEKRRANQRFRGSFRCFYRSIKKKDNTNDDTYKMGKAIKFDGIKRVKDEFIRIECTSNSFRNRNLYTEYLPFIQMKPEVEKRCNKNFQEWTRKTKKKVTERLSVTLVGIDSVSRLNLIRQMPKTHNFLKNEKNTIELQGFIKLADNTFVNVVPLLTGLYVRECWNGTMKNLPFDYLNIIWKNFSDRGYRTFYAEDYPKISAFNYNRRGFAKQPTDYYMRPFHLAVDDDSNVNKVEPNCHNNRPEANVTLQWLMDFLTTFKTKPTFSFLFNSRLTHQDINDAGRADQLYLDFFHEYSKNLLDSNSVLVFFSDHGVRFGEIRNTIIGQLEERMPFVFISFPQWFREKYPKLWKNLRANQNRLTTFFDLHRTLKQILDFTGEDVEADVRNRGLSLFSEIPPERTCEDATILPHWCTCNEKKAVALTDPRVLSSAQLMVAKINKELSGQKKCARLSVDEIRGARASGLREEIFQDSVNDVIDRKVIYGDKLPNVWEFLVTILVKPSGAVFEGTVTYYEATDKYALSGDVSRINVYGNQSHCVTSPHLKKYCYCIH